jgi:hypothetical protein
VTRPIRWDLIAAQHYQMIRYATAADHAMRSWLIRAAAALGVLGMVRATYQAAARGS